MSHISLGIIILVTLKYLVNIMPKVSRVMLMIGTAEQAGSIILFIQNILSIV